MSAEIYRGFDRFALDLRPDQDDARWLSVAIEARWKDQAWSDEDTCLSRQEAEQLATWVDSNETGALRFKEGNLTFSRSDDQISITLDLEFQPPGADAAAILTFERDALQLRAFAESLREQLTTLDDDTPNHDDPLVPPPPRPKR